VPCSGAAFPLVWRPAGRPAPVLVSVPHYGTQALPHITPADYREPWFASFPRGFADTFAADVYADLHEHGATVLATPISRMFVDVNRRRDDFERAGGEVRSRRGVVRTHTTRDAPIFTRPLGPAELEARLRALYDPYYGALDRLLDELAAAHGHAVLLDGHTGSPRRMGDHEIIIGTRHEATCAAPLAAAVAGAFARHGFDVRHNVSGYAGGNIVATYGRPSARRVHALQVEVNAGLLITCGRDELVERLRRGEMPERAEAGLARVRRGLAEALRVLPEVLAGLPAADGRGA
jgi:N-formylglutamate deformylase